MVLLYIYINLVKNEAQVFPKVKLTQMGEDAYFWCFTKGTVIWSFESKPLPYNAISERSELGYAQLTIIGVKKGNTGKYMCRAYTKKVLQFEESAQLVVVSKLFVAV